MEDRGVVGFTPNQLPPFLGFLSSTGKDGVGIKAQSLTTGAMLPFLSKGLTGVPLHLLPKRTMSYLFISKSARGIMPDGYDPVSTSIHKHMRQTVVVMSAVPRIMPLLTTVTYARNTKLASPQSTLGFIHWREPRVRCLRLVSFETTLNKLSKWSKPQRNNSRRENNDAKLYIAYSCP